MKEKPNSCRCKYNKTNRKHPYECYLFVSAKDNEMDEGTEEVNMCARRQSSAYRTVSSNKKRFYLLGTIEKWSNKSECFFSLVFTRFSHNLLKLILTPRELKCDCPSVYSAIFCARIVCHGIQPHYFCWIHSHEQSSWSRWKTSSAVQTIDW